MANIRQTPFGVQPARKRKRRRIRRGRQRIDKIERARRASFSLYKSMMSARPFERT
jgi:hypothetical protein